MKRQFQDKKTADTIVKICGLTGIKDIQYVNAARPDYIGFVFARSSRRFLAPDHAAELKERLNPAIRAVGVFVKENPERVAGLLNSHVIDLAQLHGGEDEVYLQRLRQLTDRPVIQAFQISCPDDLKRAETSSADWLLFDSPSAGSGQTFDWSLLADIHRPYFLAGGLSPANIEEALRKVHPYGVDVSSGVETNGIKDEQKIKQFIQSVRG